MSLPTIDLRIAAEGTIPDGTTVTADLDTGTEGLWLSEEHLTSLGITRGPLNFVQSARMGGSSFSYYVQKLRVSLIGSSGETDVKDILANIVQDFTTSPLARRKTARAALAGRDILAVFGAIVEIDPASDTTKVLLKDWRAFEADIADAYRILGYGVRRDVNIGGTQIDIFLERPVFTGRTERSIVMCKYSARPVDVASIRALAATRDFLTTDMRIDGAAIVASGGFTKDARLVAEALRIQLLESAELFAEAESAEMPSTPLPWPAETVPDSKSLKRAFVIMPFSQDLVDTYVFGIREPLSANGYACTRTDELEFDGRVMDKIYDLIRTADIIVAEVTEHNANVYYELGVAHAFGKAVVLCTKSMDSVPFDIRDLNHIVYRSIRELRDKLTQRVTSLIDTGK